MQMEMRGMQTETATRRAWDGRKQAEVKSGNDPKLKRYASKQSTTAMEFARKTGPGGRVTLGGRQCHGVQQVSTRVVVVLVGDVWREAGFWKEQTTC